MGRFCFDFTANLFSCLLFGLSEALFGIFTLSVLANRPLFASSRECKSTRKYLSANSKKIKTDSSRTEKDL